MVQQLTKLGEEWHERARSGAKYTGPTSAGWEYRHIGYDRWSIPELLTPDPEPARVAPMAHTEVIEWTDQLDASEDSTSIDHLWYNATTGRMTIRFSNAGLYSYDGVDHELWDNFIDAESLGQFYHENFRALGWAGAKHEPRFTKFKKVEPVKVQIPIEETDLDSLKPSLLTGGKGDIFEIHFTYSADGKMSVRAPSVEDSIELFYKYMTEHGFEVSINGIYINMKQ